MDQSFAIALAQLNSTDSIDLNFRSIVECVERAQGQKTIPKMIIFPENSLFFRIDQNAKVESLHLQSMYFERLSKLAKESQIAIHLTTAVAVNPIDKPEASEVYNASVLIRASGESPEIVYKKIHLFDIELLGQKPIRESDCFASGEGIGLFELGGFRFGSSICYDIRFAELFGRYAKREVDAILVPSAFLVKTGKAHWEVLLRARAIESQCYVLAPAQAGVHRGTKSVAMNQRETYGHTMAITPWGEIISCLESGLGMINVELRRSEIDAVRMQIPMRNHRKLL